MAQSFPCGAFFPSLVLSEANLPFQLSYPLVDRLRALRWSGVWTRVSQSLTTSVAEICRNPGEDGRSRSRGDWARLSPIEGWKIG